MNMLKQNICAGTQNLKDESNTYEEYPAKKSEWIQETGLVKEYDAEHLSREGLTSEYQTITPES